MLAALLGRKPDECQRVMSAGHLECMSMVAFSFQVQDFHSALLSILVTASLKQI